MNNNQFFHTHQLGVRNRIVWVGTGVKIGCIPRYTALGVYSAEKSRWCRFRLLSTKVEFHNYCVMMEHSTGYIVHNLDVVCGSSGFQWAIELEYLVSRIHTWTHSRYDRISLETDQNQNKNLSIIFPNQMFSYFEYHTTHVIWCKLLVVLPDSMVNHTCKYSSFITILNDFTPTVIEQDDQLILFLGYHQGLPGGALCIFRFLEARILPALKPPTGVNILSTGTFSLFICHFSSFIVHLLQLFLQTIERHPQLILIVRDTELCVLADQPALVLPVYSATSRNKNLFSLPRHIPKTEIPAHRS